jgi:hypothetical protein
MVSKIMCLHSVACAHLVARMCACERMHGMHRGSTNISMHVMRVGVCACVRVCARVRACVYACVHAHMMMTRVILANVFVYYFVQAVTCEEGKAVQM